MLSRTFILSLFLMCLISQAGIAQTYTNLVMEGAGVRGIAYVGAIQYLEEKGLTDNLQRVGGTSAGAIAALALVLGYNGKEIEKLIYETKLQKFNDGRFFFIGGISRLNRHYGWYRGKAFSRWLEQVIEKKTGDADITFRELHERHFKDLYVTGTSLNRQQLLVFSHEQYPDMRVRDAVRISMSIPLYFEAVMIDSTGHILNKKKPTTDFDVVVDGGLTGNFPIMIFDPFVTEDSRTLRTPNWNTIGLRMDTPTQIQYDSLQKGLAPIPINHFQNYLTAFYTYILENLNRGQLTDSDWKRTVSISTGNIGPRIRKLSLKEKNLLIRNGYEAMKKFIEGQSLTMPDHTGN